MTIFLRNDEQMSNKMGVEHQTDFQFTNNHQLGNVFGTFYNHLEQSTLRQTDIAIEHGLFLNMHLHVIPIENCDVPYHVGETIRVTIVGKSTTFAQ